MPRLSPEEKMAQLLKEQAEIKSKVRSTAGRIGARARKDDNKCKILLGTILLEIAGEKASNLVWIKSRIKDLEERDRKVFDRWNIDEKAPQAAARARARKAAKAAEATAAAKAQAEVPSPSNSAPDPGALDGQQRPSSAPARAEPAPSAQPIKATTTGS